MMKKLIISFILILPLLFGISVYASDVTNADFRTTIQIVNDGTALTNAVAILNLDTDTVIDADMLGADALDCTLQTGEGTDISFMPGPPGTDYWSIFVSGIAGTSSYNTYLYSKGVTDGKICMFLNPNMNIVDDGSYELSDNYSLKLNDVGLISSSDNIVAYKPNAYALTYSGGNVTFAVDGGGTLTSAVAIGEHDIEARALPSGADTEYTLRPEAEGDVTDVTGSTGANHYTEVDDTTPDENSTYVVSGGTGSITYLDDLYEIPDITCISVNKITIYARCKKNGLGWAKIILKTGGTIYENSATALTSSWTTYSEEWATNPDTLVAWTPADINNLQIGVSLAKGFAGINVESFCTQVYVVVDVVIASSAGQLLIDNTLVDSTAADCTVPDSGDNTTIGSGCTAYIGEFSTSEDDIDTCVINYEYDTIFHDDTGNGNDATPSFRTASSDPDLYATIVSMSALDLSTEPTTTDAEGWTMIPSTATTTPDNLYSEGGYDFPMGTRVKEAAESMGYDYTTWLFGFAFIAAIIAFISVFALTNKTKMGIKGSMMLSCVAAEAVLAFFYRTGTIPGWSLIPVGFLFVLLLVWRKSTAPVD